MTIAFVLLGPAFVLPLNNMHDRLHAYTTLDSYDPLCIVCGDPYRSNVHPGSMIGFATLGGASTTSAATNVWWRYVHEPYGKDA